MGLSFFLNAMMIRKRIPNKKAPLPPLFLQEELFSLETCIHPMCFSPVRF